MVQNKGLIYKSAPNGWPVPGKDLAVEDRAFDLEQPAPEGGLIVRNCYVSFDPYQRGRMREAGTKSYAPPYEIGKPITNSAIMQVVKSNSPKFQPGDVIKSLELSATEEYSVLSQASTEKAYKLNNPYNLDPMVFLGALGMPGLTAFSSFYDIGQPKKGETIFISAASGAVGQIVGQLAKHEGLKVIGSVGSDEKLNYIIKDLGFDGGFNYKNEKPAEALARLAPQGIDIYFENVGGEQLEASLNAMNEFGRIIACGMISQYNTAKEEQYPIRNLMQIVAKRITFRGFIVGDANMGPRYYKDHQEKLQKWISDGTFKVQMSVTDGIDGSVDGFLGMLKGDNFGKAILKISDIEKN